MTQFFIYMLYCENNSYYTGYTNSLTARYQAHVKGKCKYTRSFKPLGIACSWSIVGNKADAMRVERYIKTLSRHHKDELLLSPDSLQLQFPQLLLRIYVE